MFGIRTVSVGLSIALAAANATAQTQPTPQPRPAAASLGRIVAVGDGESVSPRGQVPDNSTIVPVRGRLFHPGQVVTGPNIGNPIYIQSPPATGGLVSPAVPMQQPPLGAPGVTEFRGTVPMPAPALTPGATMASPVPVGSYPYAIPGTAIYTGPTPIVGSPTYAPGTEGAMMQPEISDPFLGGTSALMPRVRGALGRVPMTGRLTLEADYLMWFINAQPTPALVTTSSPANNGILGQGNTRVLYGEETLGNTRFSGGRFAATYWMPNTKWGIDASLFFLGQNGTSYSTNSIENPVLARPFTRADTGAQFSELVTSPSLANGSVAVNSDTSMWGADVNFRRPLFCGCNSRIDALIGFRNVNLDESINITETFVTVPGANSAFAAGVVQDQFRTENHFYGVNIGLTGEVRRGRFFSSFRAAVGLGSVYQELQIAGAQQLLTNTGQQISANGGLLALPGANIGSYSQRKFGVVPEVNVTLGVYLTDHLRFGVGYNFLYMNSVLRPADQIDTGLDVTRIPNFPVPGATPVNPPRPQAYPLKTTGIFAQGITFSLQYTW